MEIIQVTFIQPNGDVLSYDARPGDTLMEVAVDNGVDGILAQCGGGCSCCTCHCWVDAEWADKLPSAQPEEADLLSYALGWRATSRLACQIRLKAEHDGLTVRVPGVAP